MPAQSSMQSSAQASVRLASQPSSHISLKLASQLPIQSSIQRAVRRVFPFTALVGQEQVKRALLANVVCPSIGGVLLRGEKGTAKSTAVRGLVPLLPREQAVTGCPWHCDPLAPEHVLCAACAEKKRQGVLPSVAFRPQLIDVPLAASEDRVVGSVDMETALREGRRRLQAGLLAAAHRGILYIDEVNLLPDHVTDSILEAASEGVNRIRRDGIAAEHPASFILVGTMNPEEGELRPQLLDRFGLAVGVSAAQDVEERLHVLRLRERFDADPQDFMEACAADEAALAQRLVEARRLLAQVRVPVGLRRMMAERVCEAHCAGHRGELALERTARAFAALAGRLEVREEDVLEAAELALAHRRRMVTPPDATSSEEHRQQPSTETAPEASSQEQNAASDTPQHEEHDADKHPDQPQPTQSPPDSQADQSQSNQPRQGNEEEGSQAAPHGNTRTELHSATPTDATEREASGAEGQGLEQIFAIGTTFAVKPIRLRTDRLRRKGSGKRSRTATTQRTGRTVGTQPLSCGSLSQVDIAWDATLRMVALKHRVSEGDWQRPVITRDDLRMKRREKKIGNLIVFAVDASGSMGAARRMEEAKGAVLSLLMDAYQKRDKVAFIAFRGQQAEVLLPPTGSVELAYKALETLPTGGRTPLASGLETSYRLISNQLRKEPDMRPVLLVLSDGRANAAPEGIKPLAAALEVGRQIAADGRIHTVMIDVERQGLLQFGMAKIVAEALQADCLHLEDLKAETLVHTLKDIV